MAVERAVSGTANKADWADIFDAINLLESLACRGWAGGRDVVVATQGVTVAILDRRRAGSNEVLPHEAVALRGIADDYSAVVSTIRRGRFEVAENEVTVRVRRILSKKAADGDLLMDIEELGL